VTPSLSSIATTQTLPVTITVSGGTPTPTGSVVLTSGSYTSAATTLSSGSAMVTIPAGSLATATDTLTASYTPDSASSPVYASASGSNSVTVTGGSAATTTLALSANPTSSTYAQQVVLIATLSPFSAQSNTTSGESVTFYNGSSSLGTGTLSGGVAMLNITALPAGTDSLKAVYAGDANFATSTSNTLPFTVSPATPTITFTVPNQTYGAAPFTVAATSNSSGAITYSVVSGPATISGATVTLTGAGTVVLQASEAALGNYAVSTQTATFTVTGQPPTISFSVPNLTYGAAPFTVAATSNSSGAFSYSVVSGPATILGSTVTITGAGTVVLQASQAAAGNYAAGTQNATFTVAAAAPTIGFSVANQTYGIAPFSVAATSNSAGAFIYSVVSGPATISGSTLTLTGLGSVTLKASQAAAGNYTSGTQNATFTVAAGAPTITFTVASQTYGATPFAVAATSNSTGAIAYSLVSGPATLSGATVTLTGAGTVVLQASEAAAGNYAAGTQNVTFAVNKATPTVALTTSANPALSQSSITLTATVSSTLAAPTGSVTFFDGTTMLGTGTIASGVAAYVTSSLPAGANSITAVYSGDTNFATVTSSALTETVETFALGTSTGATTTQTVSPGGTATYTFSVSPTGGTTFLDPVSFTVSGLPAGATATFTPQTIPAGSGTTPVTLTIQTSSQNAAVAPPGPVGGDSGGRPLIALGLMLLPLTGAIKRFHKRKATLFCMALLLMMGSTTYLVGCGGGSSGGGSSSGSQSQSYNLTVTGTSGADITTTSVTLTVQ
jgi:hypothetical protein